MSVIIIGIIILIIGFVAGKADPEIGAILTPFMIPIAILSIICGIVWLIFAVQIIHTATKKSIS